MKEHILSIVEIESRLRHSRDAHETYLLAVNVFRELLAHEMAIGFSYKGYLKAVAYSDLPDFNKKSPFVTAIAHHIIQMDLTQGSKVIPTEELSPELHHQGIAYALIVPLIHPTSRRLLGVLVFGAIKGFSNEAVAIVNHCAETIALVLAAFSHSYFPSISRLKTWAIIAVSASVVMLFPVHLSTQGKVQVVAYEPTIITAPMNGVIKTVKVKSNDTVKKGDLLLTFDDTDIVGKQRITAQTINISAAEIVKQERSSFIDPSIKNKLEESRAERAVKEMEYSAITAQLNKLTLNAPVDGTIILDAPLDLIGKPVKTGEKLLSIINPKKVEVEILLAAHESNVVSLNDSVNIYLDDNPLHPVKGEVYKINYEPVIAPSNVLSYKAFIRLKDVSRQPSVGMCGNAKIQGESVPLFWYIFRKPIAYARWYLG